jgi:hypothetical protein
LLSRHFKPTKEYIMGFFSNILEKLGMGGTAAAAAAPTDSAVATAIATPDAVVPDATPAVTPITAVDVLSQMEDRAASNPEKLNWKTSIVDLLKLLDLDSSLAARKSLATELGCDASLMEDSAKMNMWLHKEVLSRIAANGGNIPADMLS